MSSRTFEHPLHRHPSVGPVLHVISATPDVSHGRGGVQAALAQIRVLDRLEAWAMRRFALNERPGHAARLANRIRDAVPAVDALVELPTPLARLYRYDEHDAELTEVARRVHRDGPRSALAYVADRPRPSLAARRLVTYGCWPSAEPAFVGRLDDRVGPRAYRVSLALVDAVASAGRWHDAKRLADRLPPRQRLAGGRVIVRHQVRAGVGPGSLSGPLMDEYLWQCAQLSAQRDDPAAAFELIRQMQDPQRQAFSTHELRVTLGRLEPVPSRQLSPAAVGAGVHQLMQADVEVVAGRPSNAWYWLREAAAAPRRDRRCWIGGVRPDQRIARQLLYVMLRFGYRGRWPWGHRRLTALLDRLDAVSPVVDRLAERQVLDAMASGAVKAPWLQARLRQALYIRSIERLDPGAIDRQLHGSPQAEAFVRGLMGDLAFAGALSSDPADPIRALYDDGLARAPRASRRRSGVLQAARRTLHRALHEDPAAIAAAQVRLGTMAVIGGERARRTLDHQLGRTSTEHQLYPSMLSALVCIDGPTIVPRAFGAPASVGHRFSSRALHGALEAHRLVPEGFAAAVHELHGAVSRAVVEDLDGWWRALCESWWRAHRSPPTEGIMRWMSIQPHRVLRAGPEATLARFEARKAALARLDQDRLLNRLATDDSALEALMLTTPLSKRYGRPWPLSRWKRLVRRLRSSVHPIGHPDVSLVESWARWRPMDVAPSLIAGHAPLASLDAPLPVPEVGDYSVRYLHKCRDILRFWRFADVVSCCYNSRFDFYRRGDTERRVLELWRDPLSFCFEIRRREEPIGFAFGGFGRTDTRDALLLNGVYLRGVATPRLRGTIVTTIADAMMGPLRLDMTGVASRHGGAGPWPRGFERRRRPILRYRALKNRNRRVEEAFDDIGEEVNRWTDADLYWWPPR